MLVGLVGCSGGDSPDVHASVAVLEREHGLEPLTLQPGRLGDGAGWWAEQGFHRVGPPVHLPSASRDQAQVEIWVRVPEGGRVGLVERSDGQHVTDWPPGTAADRVEYRGSGAKRRVVDVRGTRLDEGGQPIDHIYRPLDRETPGTPLIGYEWPAMDVRVREAVTDAMVLRTGRESLRSKMACDRCHVPLRPDNQTSRQHGLVDRGTDADGWFTPTTVLRDVAPIEAYGRFDPNVADPYVTGSCGNGATPKTAGEPKRWWCPDDGVVLGRRDVDAGSKTNDAATQNLCASRVWISGLLSGPNRAFLEDSCEASSKAE